MAFKTARCPNCSGDLSLDPSVKKGFCMHCGSEIIIEEAIKKVKVDAVASLENRIIAAHREREKDKYKKAKEYYEKAYLMDPNNLDIIFCRAISDMSDMSCWRLISATKEVFDETNITYKDLSDECRMSFAKELNNYAIDLFENVYISNLKRRGDLEIKEVTEAHKYADSWDHRVTIHIDHEILEPLQDIGEVCSYLLAANLFAPKNNQILINMINVIDSYKGRGVYADEKKAKYWKMAYDWNTEMRDIYVKEGVGHTDKLRYSDIPVPEGYKDADYKLDNLTGIVNDKLMALKQTGEDCPIIGLKVLDEPKVYLPEGYAAPIKKKKGLLGGLFS